MKWYQVPRYPPSSGLGLRLLKFTRLHGRSKNRGEAAFRRHTRGCRLGQRTPNLSYQRASVRKGGWLVGAGGGVKFRFRCGLHT